MDKPAVRRRLLAARAPDPAGDRARDLHLAPLLQGRRVASYVAFGSEPVAPLPDGVLVPVLLPDRDLSWRTLDGQDRGLEGVADCDVVLVPALAVDRQGVRLGRGGGSYDRALRRARGFVVALLHEDELLDEELPREPHDVPVHAVALPSGVVRLPARIDA